jgi:hypothetical protein
MKAWGVPKQQFMQDVKKLTKRYIKFDSADANTNVLGYHNFAVKHHI